jgi:signal transduction histidine kinase
MIHQVIHTSREIPVNVVVVPLESRDGGYVAVIKDDYADLVQAARLEDRLRFEMLLADLHARFTSLTEEDIDGEIELWQRKLVEALGVERSSFAELTTDGVIAVTHTYSVPWVEPPHRGLAERRFPWLTRELAAGRTVVVARIPDDLPQEAVVERQHFVAVGMKAGIAIPVNVAGRLTCILTFGCFRGPREWPTDLVLRLRLAGDAFANAIDRRAARVRLAQQQHELAHVSRVAAMGELASVIAHELDQPLTAIVGNAEAARYMMSGEHADPREADEALRDVIDAAMRASEIVKRERRLLKKSRLTFEPVDLSDAVREIEIFIRGEARQAGARLVLELADDLPPVDGDRVQLQQVILNLGRNAVQAMREQPTDARTLGVRTASDNGTVTLSVSDQGPGVDPSVFTRMFEPFFTTKVHGLGMGLAISKSILDTHRGRIWPTANGDRGITMHIAIPVAATATGSGK